MPILTCFNYHFTPKWTMILITALVTSLFIYLGFWQIHRAEEKRVLLAAQAYQANQRTNDWKNTDPLPAAYQNISLNGNYSPSVFFLDNQHQQHRFGYNVLSPLVLENNDVVMIDRGWVPSEPTRHHLPNIDTPSKNQQIKGTVYYPSTKQWILGPEIEINSNKVMVIERIDVKLLAQILQKKVYPFIIRLNKEEAHGFVREWTIVSMSPERHIGYAVQWFAMALAIIILFVVLNLKKRNEKKDL